MIAILLVGVNMAAANPALVLNLGMWNTNRSLCGAGAQCVSIQNISYTECVAVGFREGVLPQMRLGTMVFLIGTEAQNVWTKDGIDADRNLDILSCIPPRTTVFGPVPSDWTIVHLDTVKHYVGDVRSNTYTDMSYTVRFQTVVGGATLEGRFYGQFYAGTGEGLVARSKPGSPYNVYDLRKDVTLVVGGR